MKAVLHQVGSAPEAGHADVLFAVSEASETVAPELDSEPDGLEGPEGFEGFEGSDGFAVPGKKELAGLAIPAEHAEMPRHTTEKAAKRIEDTPRLIDPPLRTG